MENTTAQTTEPAMSTPETTTAPETIPQTDGGGLPSEQPTSESYQGFELNDELKGKFKDGKLNGRFSSIDDVLDRLKEAEDFRANAIREQKGTEQQHTSEEVLNTKVQELMPEFIENGLQLTPEMEEKLVEGITDAKDKQLKIYEFRDKARAIADRANEAYAVVGGQENYQAMQEWAVENLSEKDKTVFTNDVNGSQSASRIAVEWLNQKYQSAVQENGGRIAGKPHTTGVKPYADRRELYRDKDYIDSAAGRRDTAAQKAYKARLKATPDAVVFGR